MKPIMIDRRRFMVGAACTALPLPVLPNYETDRAEILRRLLDVIDRHGHRNHPDMRRSVARIEAMIV